MAADTARDERLDRDLAVRAMPAQYYGHRRFKTRPEGEPRFIEA